MLNVVFFTFNAFEENTYLISNDKQQCWIVDPGMYYPEELDIIKNYITEKGLTPKGIINTHGHLDHIFGVQALQDTYGIDFGIHELEQPVLDRGADTAAMFGFEKLDVPKVSYYIKENTPLQLGDDKVDVLLVPGHSPGSIAFYYEAGKWVISGDALFAGGIGRTDLPGGDHATLLNSIRTQLFSLPADTQVLSGHGSPTFIGQEKKYNQFLK